MRPASLLSAALCGVLWASSNIIFGAVAQITTSTPVPPGIDGVARGEDCRQYIGEECVTSCINQLTTGPFTESCQLSTTILPVTQTPTGSGILVAGSTTSVSLSSTVTTFTSYGSDGAPVATSTFTLLPVTITGKIGPSLTTYVITKTLGVDTTTTSPTETSSSARSTGSSEAAVKESGTSKSSKSNTGAIVGGVVGGIVVISLIALGIFFFRRRRRNQSGTPRDAFGGLEKNRESSSPSVYPGPTPQVMTYDNPTGAPPQNVSPGEAHALMSGYPDTQPSGEVVPVVGAQKPYVVGSTEREVDEDGVSLRSPSPTLPDEGAGQGRDFVPRLPIYNRGSDETPRGPAL